MPRQRRTYNRDNRRFSRSSSPAATPSEPDLQLLESSQQQCGGQDVLLYKVMKIMIFGSVIVFFLTLPLGKEAKTCSNALLKDCELDIHCILCHIYVLLLNAIFKIFAVGEYIFVYLEKTTHVARVEIAAYSEDVEEDKVNTEVDKVIEDEITTKLSRDLAQSIEKKFHVDLEKSVNMVLAKIHLLLQNGTSHILDRLSSLQAQLEEIRKSTGTELDRCLKQYENDTVQLAEKAMHQMVVCGYALIGHNPSQAVGAVISMKNMIRTRLNPIRTQVKELDELLKLCGHEHDSLKKVIQCVIAKSPMIKSAMMDVTNKLIHGVVELTKVLAHGAMHEACLIEVVKTIEDEAFEMVEQVRNCAFGNVTAELNRYMEDDNATVLDIPPRKPHKIKIDKSKKEVVEMKELIRRMLADNNSKALDKRFKKKLLKLQDDLDSDEINTNTNITSNATNVNLNVTDVNFNVTKLLNSNVIPKDV